MLSIRTAVLDDAPLILLWRNDPVTRQNSFQSEPIPPETHIRWFQQKLDNPNCRMYMLLENQIPVGILRVDYEQEVGEISYMIAPEYRCRGYGTQLLAMVEAEATGKALLGLVQSDNIASQRCFEKNGYVCFQGSSLKCYIKLKRT